MARKHWGLVLLLALASLVRLAVAIAYRPALLWSDSWNYVYSAYSATPVRFIPEKPVGYPVAMKILGGPDESLALITSIQHLAGLATGVILYALLVRLGISQRVATGAAAIVLLDAYALALEQHILSEAFFTLAVVASMYLAVMAVSRSRPLLTAGASGLLLAVAVTMRVAALVAIPVWLLFLVWSRVGWRSLLTAGLALAIPLMGYTALHYDATRQFGMVETEGLQLYARVGQIADCESVKVSPDLRSLCPRRQPPSSRDRVDFYLYDSRSPARREFGEDFTSSRDRLAYADGRLQEFAVAVIRDRPFAFAGMLGAELLRFFEPGAMSTLRGYDDPITFPQRARPLERRFKLVRDQYQPDYVPRARPPAGVLVDYQRWLHTPRWLMGAFALAALVAVLLGIVSRRRVAINRAREILLLGGTGMALLVGAVLAHFEPRYMIPAVPLLTGAGVLAIADLRSASRPLLTRLRSRTRVSTT